MQKVPIVAATFLPLEVDLIMLRPEIRGLVGDNDKLLIADFLMGGIEAFEEYMDAILCRSTWDLYYDAFPDGNGDIEPPGPLAAVISIKYRDTTGAQQTMDPAHYVVDTTGRIPGRVALACGASWESTYGEINDVIVRIMAGYANAGAIPQRIKDGLVAYIQQMLSGVDMTDVYRSCWDAYRRPMI